MKLHSITFKLFFSMFFLCLFCLTTFWISTTSTYTKALQNQEISYNLQASDKIKAQFDFTIDLIKRTSLTLTHILQDPTSKEADNIHSLLENILEIQPFINAISIIDTNGLIHATTLQNTPPSIDPFYTNYFSSSTLIDANSELWTSIHSVEYSPHSPTRVISYIKPVFNAATRQLIGYITMDIDYHFMHNLFMVSSIQVNEKVMIVNSSGEILFNFPHFTSFEPILKRYPEIITSNKLQMKGKVFGKDSIIVSERIQLADWKIVRMIQLDTITKSTHQITTFLKTMIILCGLLSLLYSIWLSHTLTKPILELHNACKRVEKGDFNFRVQTITNDEIGHLTRTFNTMLDQLHNFFQKEIENEKRKSEIQFQVLQAQINPHFLYNTLDSIKWLAIMQNVGNIATMSTSLINLLKYNLTDSNAITTLNEEFESVTNYVNIQKFRYSDTFGFSYDLAADTLDCKVIRFILQPLVENCILHGFDELCENYTIHITSLIKDECLHIKVIDNGSGMDLETTELLNQVDTKTKRFNHIGIKNIRERITLHFGPQYGLFYTSEIGVGTTAEIILPVLKP